MKKILKNLILSTTLMATLVIGYNFIQDPEQSTVKAVPAPIVIDHNSVDLYDDIPQNYIDQIKTMRLNLIGESHAQAYGAGLSLLQAQDSKFAVINSVSPAAPVNDKLRFERGYSANLDGSYNPHNGEAVWYTNATNRQKVKDYINWSNTNVSGRPIAAIGFGWCWDMTRNAPSTYLDPVHNVHWYGSSVGGPDGDKPWGLNAEDSAGLGNSVNMDTYLNATKDYQDYVNSQGQDTRVFFTTGPVEGGNNIGEKGYQRYLKHQYIRDFVNTNNGVLFDYADILAYDNAGNQETKTWNGHTFPFIHPDNAGNDTGHIGNAGALRLGKAVWVMMARMAGWDGQPSGTDTTAPEVNVNYSTTDPTNQTVTATLTSNEDLQDISGWTKVTAREFTKEFSDNQSFTLTVSDLANNTTNVDINVSNIDKTAPTTVSVTNSVTNPTNQDVTVTVEANEEIKVPAGWSKDGANKIKKTFSDNTSGQQTVNFTDLAGNSGSANYEVSNIDKTKPTVNAVYSITIPTNQDVIVTVVSNEDLQNISGWTKVTAQEFTKEFSSNQNFTLTVSDLAGNQQSVNIKVENIDKEKPTIALNGEEVMVVAQNSLFTDPGATCNDNYDTSCSVVIGGDTVNTSVAGQYQVTYNATDQAGNVADQKTRTVKVLADSDGDGVTDDLEANYGTDPNDANSTIVSSTTLNQADKPAAIGKAKMVVSSGMCNHITKLEALDPSVSQAGVDFVGGLSFELHCGANAEQAKVEFTLNAHYQDLTKVKVYKKLGASLNDITSQVALANVAGKTTISYDIADNSTWDEDSSNMVIKDPIYIGLSKDQDNSSGNNALI